MMKAFDTHIHLDLLSDLDAQLDQARKAGVSGWLIPGVEPEGWSRLLSISEQYADVYVAPGLHPQAAEQFRAEDLIRLRKLMSNPRVIAVGEVGIDTQLDVSLQAQEDLFIQMIGLAREAGKPLLIHARRSSGRILELLKKEKAEQVGGIFHAFSGNLETAQRILDLGFALGIGGVVTWPTAKRLPVVVKNVPADALVVETDAPYMTPAPYQGQENRPALLAEVIKKIAELREWSTQTATRVTTENARRVLNFSE